MTPDDVSKILHERGVRELATPTVARYLDNELSLDVAARPLANLVRAVVHWRATTGLRRVEVLPPEEVVRLYPTDRHAGGSLTATRVPPALVADLGVEQRPSVRNADPDAVYDEAVQLNACYTVVKQFVRRRVRALRLYARVARVATRAAADAA